MNINLDLIKAINAEVVSAIDKGAPGYVEIFNASNASMAVLPLTLPCGTINADTGQLTITYGARMEEATLGGQASYGNVCNKDDTVIFGNIPCVESATPVANSIALVSITLVQGSPVEGISFTIG